MKSSVSLLLFLAALLFFFSACKNDEPLVEVPVQQVLKTYPNVDELLWVYFRRFEKEALERGFVIDLNAQNLTGEIREIDETNIAGTCTFNSHNPNHITIDLTFWNRSSDLFKEMILFHELGHCSLFRGHREDANSDGTCASIMRSGLEDCRDNYRVTTREVYLDELFEGLD